ncbi:Hydroxyacylglutathione hydrolase [uncultured archaeon]|nr:Hydroxyacylglutathione hydrolase [uncultured archaeon]
MRLLQLDLGGFDSNWNYLFWDESMKVGGCVDPGGDVDALIAAANTEGVKIQYVFITHGHFDHTGGYQEVRKKTGAKVVAHTGSQVKADEYADDGSKYNVGGIEVECLFTPGHEPHHICYYIRKENALFTGDLLFVDGVGRADLPGGDVDVMRKSLKRLAQLPDGTIVYPGHDYGWRPSSTIGEQKQTNPYMALL